MNGTASTKSKDIGNRITFDAAYFIKLGRGGKWEEDCIRDGMMRLGFNNPYHDEHLAGDYENYRQALAAEGKSAGTITSIVNQVRRFYEADSSTMWITFYHRQLWWGTALPDIKRDRDGTRVRMIAGGWKSYDTNGQPLSVDRLSGRLTKVQMYRGTICEVRASSYLRRRLNGKSPLAVAAAEAAYESLVGSLVPVIRLLTWRDFELLADLIFTNGGWQRMAIVGRTVKNIDLDLKMPVSGTRAFVQVKASSNQDELNSYVADFQANDLYDEMYYVVHSTSNDLKSPADCPKKVTILNGEKLARLCVDAGLTDWLMKIAG